jgi:hypothetical protein
MRGVIDYSKADLHSSMWWTRWKYLIRALEEDSREKLLYHAYEFQLALVSSSKLSSEDFSKLQKECKELFADLEGSLRPWLGRSSEDRHTKDVVNFKEQWKALAGFDPDDAEAKAKWEKEIEGLASAVSDRIKKAEDETAGKETAFYTKLENLRLKRLRQQGRIK